MRALLPLLAACSPLGRLVPPTVDEDPTLPALAIEVSGVERLVHVHTFGDPSSPVLLMLHGSLADHRAFLPYEALSDRYFVVMWDQRGNGLSERITADEYTWDSIVEEIDALKAEFSPDAPVTLVGHSFGAMYASLYVSTKPENVHQLVLMEPGGLTGEIMGATYGDIISVDLLGAGLNEAFWQSEVMSARSHEAADYKALRLLLDGHQTSYHCDPDHPVPFPVWRPGAHVDVLRTSNMGVAQGAGGVQADFDFAFGLAAFEPSVLLIAGSCSGLGPEMQARWHVPLFRQVELVTIADAGHRMLHERFDATMAALDAYLDAP